VAQPVLFTVEFRRKMASLSQAERLEWLASLAARLAAPAAPAAARAGGPGSASLPELGEVARGCRLALVDTVERQLGPFDKRFLDALLEVPRERFVRPDDVARSADDTPLPLDDEGMATISAPHAYLLSFRLLELTEGDGLIELGTGSGYGAALAAFIVGRPGRVVTFEIDPVLVAWARRTLSGERNVTVAEGDAITSAPRWEGAKKVVATFAVAAIPPAWLAALPEGGALVAPVGLPDREQRLVLVTKRGGVVTQSDHGAVRYVKNRSRF
jgi:protein-L-isoaspartate(D-aspartate) O-methyltransferase